VHHDLRSGAGVLTGDLDRLEAAEVDAGLDVPRVAVGEVGPLSRSSGG